MWPLVLSIIIPSEVLIYFKKVANFIVYFIDDNDFIINFIILFMNFLSSSFIILTPPLSISHFHDIIPSLLLLYRHITR